MTRERLWAFQHRAAPYVFVSPFVVLFCVFLLYPLARSLVLSMYKTAGPENEKFVGLANYAFLLTDPLFWWSVLNTSLFTVAFLVIQIPVSLGLAVLLNNRRVRFRGAFRFAFFSTHLVGPDFVAVLFSILLNARQGLLNQVIGAVVGTPVQINWLGSPYLAMTSVLLAALWLGIGWGMIYFLAALQAVDLELYDAASVDGAGKWQQFLHVTLPGIRPVLVFMILIGSIGAFQLFELPYVLFNGPGPAQSALTIVMYLFATGFEAGDLGYAAAIGWLLVLILFGLALLQLKLFKAGRDDA